MRAELEKVREWAYAKALAGREPPWNWYQYMKLVEAANAILKGMASTVILDSSQESELRSGPHLRLVEPTCQRDTAQPHQPESPASVAQVTKSSPFLPCA
jgi:hypothetical protein